MSIKQRAVIPSQEMTATDKKQDVSMTNYTTSFSPLSMALTWLKRGVSLLPLQPGSKHIIPGFGPYSKRIETPEQARFWFVERHANLGAICGAGMVVLDFDDEASHARWTASWPGAAASYTEKTMRGFHVHFQGESRSYRHPDGFEVKGQGAVVMIAPSQRGGFVYHPLDAGAQLQSLPAALSLLSESSKATPTLSKGNGDDLVARIKSQVAIVDVARNLTRITSKNGRWWHGRCPFHDDRKPSFWLDSERGLFGCYSCKVRGDTINLYALAHNLTIQEAIASLAQAVQQ